jgi:hypothetical protein
MDATTLDPKRHAIDSAAYEQDVEVLYSIFHLAVAINRTKKPPHAWVLTSFPIHFTSEPSSLLQHRLLELNLST